MHKAYWWHFQYFSIWGIKIILVLTKLVKIYNDFKVPLEALLRCLLVVHGDNRFNDYFLETNLFTQINWQATYMLRCFMKNRIEVVHNAAWLSQHNLIRLASPNFKAISNCIIHSNYNHGLKLALCAKNNVMFLNFPWYILTSRKDIVSRYK